jgi:hypothetical protein
MILFAEVIFIHQNKKLKQNPRPLVRKRSMPTDRAPLVGEVNAIFCGEKGVALSAQRIPNAIKLGFESSS